VSRLSGVPSLPIHWHHPTGPHFGNALSTMTFDGREARLLLERATTAADSDPSVREQPTTLRTIVELDLTRSPEIRTVGEASALPGS
jgi:hypothetical protein